MRRFFISTKLLFAWYGVMASLAGFHRTETADCPSGGNLTVSKGSLQSPGYPTSQYLPNTACVWVVTAPRGEHVKLMFKEVDLEYCALCHCDYVEVREGASSDGQLIGRFCIARKIAVYSEGGQMWVQFKSDMGNQGRGFIASFSTIKLHKKDPVILHANGTSGFIKSSNNPAVCGSARQCIWEIFSPKGFNIRLNLESFEFPSCSGSFIEIRDGPSFSSELIGKFCGDERPPPDLCSLGNSLHITYKYNSTRDLQMNQFELMYRATQCTNLIREQGLVEPVNSDHLRSMAVGIACTSFFLFVVLVTCFLKIAHNNLFVGLERSMSRIELNLMDSSFAETTLCNDMDVSLITNHED